MKTYRQCNRSGIKSICKKRKERYLIMYLIRCYILKSSKLEILKKKREKITLRSLIACLQILFLFIRLETFDQMCKKFMVNRKSTETEKVIVYCSLLYLI